MCRAMVLCLCLVLFPVVVAAAEDGKSGQPSETKELSGMSIVGNDDAPKSLISSRGKAPKSAWRPALPQC